MAITYKGEKIIPTQKNPLAIKPESDADLCKEERVLNTIFQNYEALDTVEKLKQAVRNVENALHGCEAWQKRHSNEDGEIDADTPYGLFLTYEEEEHLLWLLDDILSRRQDLLEAAEYQAE